MKFKAIYALAYGALLLIGGIYGGVHSKASIIAGSISGLIATLGGWQMLRGSDNARKVVFSLACLLNIFFIYRFIRTQNFFPAGLMSMVSLSVAYILYSRVKLPLGQ